MIMAAKLDRYWVVELAAAKCHDTEVKVKECDLLMLCYMGIGVALKVGRWTGDLRWRFHGRGNRDKLAIISSCGDSFPESKYGTSSR